MSVEEIGTARERAAQHVFRTPLLRSRELSEQTGSQVWLKAENLQHTGAFKVRGAINAVLSLTPDERWAGAITVSAGNHGMALSFAGRVSGVHVTVVMPDTAVKAKVAAVERYGGKVILTNGTRLMETMENVQRVGGQTFIHPFDRPEVIAGQGTVGLEIAEDMPDVQAVIVPVGGGGLISGVATAMKSLVPSALVIGVEPEGSTAVSRSLAAGEPVRLEAFATVADGLNAPWAGPNSLSIIQRLVDRVVTVSDNEIVAALARIARHANLIVEPAGAAAVAALLSGRLPELIGKRVVAILSGGNVDGDRLAHFLVEA
ncbi:MAG TPA: threonine/serine dehydratase [Chloroflexota bacterium]|jgi:threonine dehydratase|nr:threonine/serine dehydratase [Chloroflexota bacterium]